MMTNENIRILLADDDADDRTEFKEAFETLRMHTVVQTLNNGVELMKFLNDDASIIPDILFLDLNMPKKSGLECLSEIRKMKRLDKLTIVIFSTSSSQKDIEETFFRGANIYLKKPAHFTVLKKTLRHILAINWQYYNSDLNRDNYLFQL